MYNTTSLFVKNKWVRESIHFVIIIIMPCLNSITVQGKRSCNNLVLLLSAHYEVTQRKHKIKSQSTRVVSIKRILQAMTQRSNMDLLQLIIYSTIALPLV